MLSSRLKSLRNSEGLSQQNIATLIGVSRQVYNNYELGKREPDYDTIMRFSEYYNVTTDYLLGKSDNPFLRMNGQIGVIEVRILGNIPAGIPIEAVEDVIDIEEVPLDWGRGGKEYFGLKIKGDSMFPEYLDGEIVIFLKADDCESGDDCAVIINGEDATFKKVIKQQNGVVLQPLNTTSYVPAFYSNDDIENLPVRILGIAVQSRRKRGRLGIA